MDIVAQFELMSDAAQLATVGGALWVFAGFAALMERRRIKSRIVARLEEDLGVRLLQRTTRSLHLTDTGRRYYERARQALAAQFHETDMGNADVAEWAWQTYLSGVQSPSLSTLQAAILAVEPHALEHAATHLLDNALYLASAPPPDGLLPRAQQPFTHV